MGCGASLKVTAISQPTSRQEPGAESGERQFKRTHFRFKLPAEVLQGFAEVLKIVSRKTEKRKKPQFAEPSEASVDQGQQRRSTNHPSDAQDESAASHRDDSKSAELFAVQQSPDVSVSHEPPVSQFAPQTPVAKKPTPEAVADPIPEVSAEKKPASDSIFTQKPEQESEKPAESPLLRTITMEQAPVAERIEEKSHTRVEAEKLPPSKQKTIFYRVEDQKEGDRLDGGGLSPGEEVQESDLLSPEAPRVLPDEEYEEPVSSSQRKSVRIELERKAQEEAERLAAEKRTKDEEALETQRGKMKGMEDAAQSILSKYQCVPWG